MRIRTAMAALTVLCAFSLHAGEKIRPTETSDAGQVYDLPFCGSSALRIILPLEYRVSVDKSTDFRSYSVRATSKYSASLDIVISHNLSITPKTAVSHQQAIVAGQKVDWNSWVEAKDGKSFYYREGLLTNVFSDKAPDSNCETDIMVMFYATGSDYREVLQLTDRLSTLKLHDTKRQ